jgi:hypothetical protein
MCTHLRGALIEIDHYGERLVGCLTCNLWARRDTVIEGGLGEGYQQCVAGDRRRDVARCLRFEQLADEAFNSVAFRLRSQN